MVSRTLRPSIKHFSRLCPIGTILLGASRSCFAGEGIYGTKTSPISATTTDSNLGAMPIAQMFVALLLVLALLKWVMPLVLKKVNRKNSVTTSGIRIQETATLGAGNVYVVEVRGRSYLIGATPTSMNLLADLSETREEPLKTFQEMVEDAIPQPMSTQKQAMGDLLGQLERLKTFGSSL